LAKKRRLRKTQIVSFAMRVARFLLKSQLLTVFLLLCGVGFWAGTRMRPDMGTVQYDELFENMSVLSYREAPSDSLAHFVVELSAGGRVFQEYDVDSHRFMEPTRGRDYRRSISGTRYPALSVRGHVDRGFWLELPSSTTRALLPEQFQELYRTTLDYVKPVSITTTVLGTLSGYSIGYRAATWSHSLYNPAVQARVLAAPGMARMIAREAWRRVLIEPVVMVDEGGAGRFAAIHGTQRLYTNFFRLALNDSDAFIPHEVARLDSTGHAFEARTMLAFAKAVNRAAQDTCNLGSADFSAIENWASLLDRRGHWSQGATPRDREERMQYLGMLTWYGLGPQAPDERRIWVGPRLLVSEGDSQGFIADEIPLSRVGCPVAWRPWLRNDGTAPATNSWSAHLMGASRELAPVVEFGRGVAGRFLGRR
jgi:hypothetical protein